MRKSILQKFPASELDAAKVFKRPLDAIDHGAAIFTFLGPHLISTEIDVAVARQHWTAFILGLLIGGLRRRQYMRLGDPAGILGGQALTLLSPTDRFDAG